MIPTPTGNDPAGISAPRAGVGSTSGVAPLNAREFAVLHALSLACYVVDAQGRITFFNAAARELWGRAPRLGDEFWSGASRVFAVDGAVLPPERLPIAIALREARAVRGIELLIERPDGTRRRVASNPDPIVDAEGNVTGVINVLVDVTDQHRANLDAFRLAAIVESSDDAIVSKTLDGVITSWNGGAQRLFGYTADEAIGRSVTLLIPTDRHHEELAIISRITAGQRVEHFETIRQHKDGRRLFVSLTVSPLRDGAGRIVGASKIARDITAQKRQETELRQREQMYRAIGESLDYGIWMCDADGKNLFVSDSFLELVGLSQEQCTNLGWKDVLHPDEADATVQAWQECVRTGAFWEREHRFKGRDGKWHPVLARGRPVYDKGHIVRWVGINLDISAYKRTQEELSHRTRTLEILNEVGNALVAERELERIVQAVTDAGREISGAAFGAFFYNRVNAAGESYTLFTLSGAPRAAFEKFPMPRNTPLFAPTFKGEGPVRIADVLADPRFGQVAPHRGMPAGHLPVRSYLSVPVVARSGEVLGGLFYGHPEPDRFTAEAEAVLTSLAAHAAIAIENVKLYSALERELAEQRKTEFTLRQRGRRMQLLSETLAELLAAGEPDQILLRLGPKAAELIDADTFVIYLLEPDGRSLRLLSSAGVPADVVERSKTLALGQGISGTVAETMTPRIVANVQDSNWDKAQPARALGVRTYACLPLVANARTVATIAFASRTRDSFAEDEIEFLRVLAQSTAVAFERRRYLEAVRQSEQQLRLVTDHAPIYLAHIDRAHRFKFVNRTYAQRYGRTTDDIVGRHVSELTGEEAYGTFRVHVDRCLEGHRVEFEMEIPYRTLGRRWVHVIYEPERQPDGVIVGLVAVIVDVTQRKHAEHELERARDEALAASRAKDAFLAALSHELRTPLNPVLLLASAAANNPELPAEVRADFDTIRKHVDLEARLIEDLLDLTRISHGKLALQMSELDAHDILRDALATVRAEVQAKSLTLATEFAPGPAPVWADSVRLQQVFWNIVNNAVKFTPAGGRIAVKTIFDPTAKRLRVQFTDSGIGMTGEEIARAFEAFAQGEHAATHGLHRYGGLGLGLSISRMLVEAHGGTIAAVSAGRGQGTTLTIELPLHARTTNAPVSAPDGAGVDSTAPSAGKDAGSPAAAGAEKSPPVRVLLVEDHAPTRDALERLLARRNCTLRAVGSMAEAWACAEQATFDLLVSDLGLPDGDGYQLMARLRAKWPDLPGIALSGYGMEEDLVRAREAGFAAHLVKPVRIEALEKAMARVVVRREVRPPDPPAS